MGEQTGLGEGGGKGETSAGLDGAARQLSSHAESERSISNEVRIEDGDMWMYNFVGADGHPSVGSGAHLVSPSLDVVCPYVGQCCDTLGPAQGLHVPSSAGECHPRCRKTSHPVEDAVEG